MADRSFGPSKPLLLFVLVFCTNCSPLFDELAEISYTPQQARVLRAEVTVHPEVLKRRHISFAPVPNVPLFPSIALRSVTERLQLGENREAWVGEQWLGGLRGKRKPLPVGQDAFIMTIDGDVEARFRYERYIYRLHSLSRNKAILEVYDDTLLLDRWHHEGGAPTFVFSLVGDPPCEDSAERIDVMLLYTDAAAAESSNGAASSENTYSTEHIKGELELAIEATNNAYDKSESSVRIEPVHMGPVPDLHSEASYEGFLDPLGAFKSDLRSSAEVLRLRSEHSADLVIIVYEFPEEDPNTEICGSGASTGLATTASRHETTAFVSRRCAGAQLTVAHEVGHALGAGHQRFEDGFGGVGGQGGAGGSSDDYNYGFYRANAGKVDWRTAMTTRDVCHAGATGEVEDCARDEFFSTPLVENSDGELVGSDEANNVLAMSKNAAAVSGYRCSRTGDLPHVFIRDHWGDEGGQPDSGTASLALWETPSIWVRNQKDGIEEHQEPVAGQSNYVYVRLRNNGGAPQTGAVEVHTSQAGLNPSSWDFVGKRSGVTVDAGKSKVLPDPIEWDVASSSSNTDYSLLARWDTSGAPLVVADTIKAARARNRVAWRNTKSAVLKASGVWNFPVRLRSDASPDRKYLVVTTTTNIANHFQWHQVAEVELESETEGTTAIEMTHDSTINVLGTYPPGDEPTLRIKAKDVGSQEDKLTVVRPRYTIVLTQINKDSGDDLLGLEPDKRWAKLQALHAAGLVEGGATFELEYPVD